MPIYKVTVKHSKEQKQFVIKANTPVEAKMKGVKMAKWENYACYASALEIASEEEYMRYE